MLGVVGILLSLFVLMLLAYRNHSVIVIAPICALLAVAVEGELPLLATYTQIFLESLGKFIVRYFPLFLLGAVFGKLMEETGSAASIAQWVVRWIGASRAILALVLTCAILTYGGVSLFVVVFTVFPLGLALFRQANLPPRLIPASIALGAFTFTMTALPGSVQIQNLIPMPFFKTTSFAAPGMGCLAAAIMFALGMLWLSHRGRMAVLRGDGFGAGMLSESLQPDAKTTSAMYPSLTVALAPLVCLVVLNFAFSQVLVPNWQVDYLAEKRFGATSLVKVQGLWATILAMLGAILCLVAIHWRRGRELKEIVSRGANSSLLPVFNAASEFGYGSTIAALSGFGLVKEWMVGIAPAHPLVSEAISVNVLAGITGSASGGLSIALEALGQTYFERGLAAGISPEVMHRVASLSCGGLDTLPHNGAVITLLLICNATHKESYWDIAMVSVVVPMVATIVVIALS
ncbi:GntP family permease [Schlesneria paludicola]|uniref:GntP family permease n=1 Tax=Schlesneria paludicola TaxID=360056 RepID=UPI00029A6DA9|nr:GntP family permease [Schlesneria paludicola]